MDGLGELISQVGLVGALLVLLLIWVLKTSSEQLKQFAEERKAYLNMIEEQRKTLNEHNQVISEQSKGVRDFQAVVAEAHRFQRDEHTRMIDLLSAIQKKMAL